MFVNEQPVAPEPGAVAPSVSGDRRPDSSAPPDVTPDRTSGDGEGTGEEKRATASDANREEAAFVENSEDDQDGAVFMPPMNVEEAGSGQSPPMPRASGDAGSGAGFASPSWWDVESQQKLPRGTRATRRQGPSSGTESKDGARSFFSRFRSEVGGPGAGSTDRGWSLPRSLSWRSSSIGFDTPMAPEHWMAQTVYRDPLTLRFRNAETQARYQQFLEPKQLAVMRVISVAAAVLIITRELGPVIASKSPSPREIAYGLGHALLGFAIVCYVRCSSLVKKHTYVSTHVMFGVILLVAFAELFLKTPAVREKQGEAVLTSDVMFWTGLPLISGLVMEITVLVQLLGVVLNCTSAVVRTVQAHEMAHSTPDSQLHVAIAIEIMAYVFIGVAIYSHTGHILEQFAMRLIYDHERSERMAQLKHAQVAHSKMQYLSQIAHDIGTPLTAFALATDGLRITNLTPAQRPFVATQVTAVEYLISTRNKAMDMVRSSSLSAGLPSPQMSATSLRRVLIRCHRIMEAFFDRSSINCRLRMSTDVADVVELDESWFSDILLNLLSNAYKHTKEGHITVSVSRRQKTLRVAVADTGPGVPDDKKSFLFKPFHQLQSDMGGTGLGLYGIRCKVEVMGGRVGIGNNKPHGAIFMFELPYVPLSSSGPHQTLSARAARNTPSPAKQLSTRFSALQSPAAVATTSAVSPASPSSSSRPEGRAGELQSTGRGETDASNTPGDQPRHVALSRTRSAHARPGSRFHVHSGELQTVTDAELTQQHSAVSGLLVPLSEDRAAHDSEESAPPGSLMSDEHSDGVRWGDDDNCDGDHNGKHRPRRQRQPGSRVGLRSHFFTSDAPVAGTRSVEFVDITEDDSDFYREIATMDGFRFGQRPVQLSQSRKQSAPIRSRARSRSAAGSLIRGDSSSEVPISGSNVAQQDGSDVSNRQQAVGGEAVAPVSSAVAMRKGSRRGDGHMRQHRELTKDTTTLRQSSPPDKTDGPSSASASGTATTAVRTRTRDDLEQDLVVEAYSSSSSSAEDEDAASRRRRAVRHSTGVANGPAGADMSSDGAEMVSVRLRPRYRTGTESGVDEVTTTEDEQNVATTRDLHSVVYKNRPVVPAGASVGAAMAAAASDGSPMFVPSSWRPGRRASVLVVEDSTTVRKMLMHHLLMYGLEVDGAENGAVGLRMLRERDPEETYDLVLVDMHMPEMNGMEMTSQFWEWWRSAVVEPTMADGHSASADGPTPATSRGSESNQALSRSSSSLSSPSPLWPPASSRSSGSQPGTRDSSTGSAHTRRRMLIQRVRTVDNLPTPPQFCLATGGIEPGLEELALAAGLHYVMNKPLVAMDVVELLLEQVSDATPH